MEHNYKVKTSNRVLTVARSNRRITEDFLWLAAGCFLIHIWSQSQAETGPGLAFLGCSDKVLHWLHYSLN